MTDYIEIRGLPRGTDEDDVVDLCIEFGSVAEVTVRHRPGGGPLVRVAFREAHEALQAIDALDKSFVDGCRLRVWSADEDGDHGRDYD